MNRIEVLNCLSAVRNEVSKHCCGTVMDKELVMKLLDSLVADHSVEYQRRVVCAANRFPDGTILIGARHWDPWMHQQAKQLGYTEKVQGVTEQGFIDNQRNYLTREEAWIIANEAGQIIRRCGGDEGCLYSENIC